MAFEDTTSPGSAVPNNEHSNRGSGGTTGPRLSDPSVLKMAAEMFARGCSRADMSETIGVTKATITNWRRDPRMKDAVGKIIEDRVLRVTSKLDAILEDRLQRSDDLPVETLLKMRKEFLGGAYRAATQGGTHDEKMINAVSAELEADPELAAKLMKMLEGTKSE